MALFRHMLFQFLLICMVGTAHGARIELATATGFVGIFYKAGGETSANRIYLQSLFSPSNYHGASLTFSSAAATLLAVNEDVSTRDYALDAIVILNHAEPAPQVPVVDNVDGDPTHAVSAGSGFSFAVNDYSGSGPGDTGSSVVNSLFRGSAISFNFDSPTVSYPTVTISASGTLVTDGLIHWSDPTKGTTPLSAIGLGNTFYLSTVLTHNLSTDDPNDLVDYYSGTLIIEAESLLVPEPGTLGLLGFGLLAPLMLRRPLRCAMRPVRAIVGATLEAWASLSRLPQN